MQGLDAALQQDSLLWRKLSVAMNKCRDCTEFHTWQKNESMQEGLPLSVHGAPFVQFNYATPCAGTK